MPSVTLPFATGSSLPLDLPGGSGNSAVAFPQLAADHADNDKIQNVLETWQTALLNLHESNPLLSLPDAGIVDVGAPHAFSEVFKLLIHRSKPVTLWNSHAQGFDKTTLTQPGNYVSRPAALEKLHHLHAQADALIQSQDVNVLFVGFGTLTWQNENAQTLCSPILLLPVTLKRSINGAGYVIERMEQEVEINPLLRYRLQQTEGGPFVFPAMPEEAYLVASAYLSDVAATINERDGWSVQERCFLCRFPLLKMRLYEDIVQQKTKVQNHPLTRALAQNVSNPLFVSGTPFPDIAATTNDAVSPFEFQLLDADPAQEKALHAAARGDSFVLHGPPGTGKTQTITNIVGQCIAMGKSVLLVSGRVASLDAVQQRLSRRGLGGACLSAHSMTTSKRDILQQLGQSLKPRVAAASDTPAAALTKMPDSERKMLEQLRQELDTVVHELHLIRAPLGLSLYEAHARIAENERAGRKRTPLRFGANKEPIAVSTWEAYQNQEAVAQRIASHPLRAQFHESSVWQGAFAPAQTEFPGLKDTVERTLEKAMTTVRALSGDVENIAEAGGFSPSLFQTMQSIQSLLQGLHAMSEAPPLSLWLHQHCNPTDFQKIVGPLREQASVFSVRSSCLKKEKDRLHELWDASVLTSIPSHETADLVRRFTEAGESILQPFLGVKWQEATIKHDTSLSEALQALQTACDNLHTEGEQLAEACGVSPSRLPDVLRMGGALPLLVQIAQQASRFSAPHAAWFYSQDALIGRKKLLNEAESRWTIMYQQRHQLLSAYEKEILTLDHAALRESIGTAAQTHWLLSTPAQLRSRRTVQATLKPGVLFKERDVNDDLDTAARIRAGEKWFEENGPLLRDAFEPFYQEEMPDWDDLRKQITAAEALYAIVFRNSLMGPSIENGLPLALISQVADLTGRRLALLQQRSETVAGLLTAASEAWKQVSGIVSETEGGVLPPASMEFAQLAGWCEANQQAIMERRGLWEEILCLRRFPDANMPVATVAAELKAASKHVDIQKVFDADAAKFASHIGLAPCETTAEWEAICAAFDHALFIGETFAESDLLLYTLLPIFAGDDENTRNIIKKSHIALQKSWAEANAAFVDMDALFAPSYRRLNDLPLQKTPFDELQNWVQTRLDNTSSIEGANDMSFLWNECSSAGLIDFFANLDESPLLPNETVLSAFRSAFFRGWVEAIESEVPVLKTFNANLHEKKIERFCQLDRKLHDAASGKIRQAIKGSVNKQTLRDEIGVLTGQLARRRTGEVRGLLAQMPNLLLALKPCVMMNPLSIHRYLDPDAISFDVVLFDDASQIATEEAIGAIVRGKQVIIAGDLQQLPPLPLMEESPDENKESILDAGSRLAACGLPAFTRHALNWHYRSMNETLIAYSRRYFYPDLISFPSAVASAAVETVSLPKDDENDAESARLVVDRVFAYAEREPHHSIGIIAMDERQQQAILDEIALRKVSGGGESSTAPVVENPDDGSDDAFVTETFFVKTIENVQGEERDMVLLCIPSKQERWDALNQTGGDRLLNVAATRARRYMMVATPLSSNDIALLQAQGTNDAASILKPFLQVVEETAASHGTKSEPDDTVGTFSRHNEPGVEDKIALALTERGYQVRRRVGLGDYKVDLAVVDAKNPDRYLLGIICDGVSYAHAQTARQRDRQHPQMLRDRGWNLLQIWSAAWNAEPRKQLERIEAALA